VVVVVTGAGVVVCCVVVVELCEALSVLQPAIAKRAAPATHERIIFFINIFFGLLIYETKFSNQFIMGYQVLPYPAFAGENGFTAEHYVFHLIERSGNHVQNGNMMHDVQKPLPHFGTLPPIGRPVHVQLLDSKCMAYRDKEGQWKEFFTHEPLPRVLGVVRPTS
jgi:hypothetical protein